MLCKKNASREVLNFSKKFIFKKSVEQSKTLYKLINFTYQVQVQNITQIYFGALVIVLDCYFGNQFQNTCLKKPTTIQGLKKSQSNDKLLYKMSSSYHMEQTSLIEASCIYNIHTGEKLFADSTFDVL